MWEEGDKGVVEEEEERNSSSNRDLKGRQDSVGMETTQKYFTYRSGGAAAIFSKGNSGSLFDVKH